MFLWTPDQLFQNNKLNQYVFWPTLSMSRTEKSTQVAIAIVWVSVGVICVPTLILHETLPFPHDVNKVNIQYFFISSQYFFWLISISPIYNGNNKKNCTANKETRRIFIHQENHTQETCCLPRIYLSVPRLDLLYIICPISSKYLFFQFSLKGMRGWSWQIRQDHDRIFFKFLK